MPESIALLCPAGYPGQPLPPMNPLSSHNPNTAFQGSEEDGEQSREKEGMHVPWGESYMPRTKYCVR